MFHYFLHTLKNAFNFSGRARRKEYLIFLIGSFIFGLLIGLMGIFVFGLNEQQLDKLGMISQLLFFIPTIAVGIRRLHDVGKSGWFFLLLLIPFFNLYVFFYLMLIKKGDIGDNQYGPDPKTED
jgi:uncharacterized membrane protein YhaH (DUF805 family)